MKKRIAFRKLGRTPTHKWHMLRNMVTSLVQHERIVTTVAKAKELRHLADHMITLAKHREPLHGLRQAAAILTEKSAITKLTEVLGPRYEYREGGYTRVLKLAERRYGDGAEMAVMEYVDRPGEVRAARPPRKFLEKMGVTEMLRDMGLAPPRTEQEKEDAEDGIQDAEVVGAEGSGSSTNAKVITNKKGIITATNTQDTPVRRISGKKKNDGKKKKKKKKNKKT
jgi:large subunit ribosomal protein L17